jgi:hypothetical protein
VCALLPDTCSACSQMLPLPLLLPPLLLLLLEN